MQLRPTLRLWPQRYAVKMSSRSEIEAEVESMLETLPKKKGRREILTAWLQGSNGLPVDQNCPDCDERIEYNHLTKWLEKELN